MSNCHRKLEKYINCTNKTKMVLFLLIFKFKQNNQRNTMKKILFAGIVLLGMSMTAIAEEKDEFDDEFSEEINPMEVVQDFMDDCDKHGDYYGCFSVAMKYEKGDVLEKDISKAIEYYGKACKHGSEEGCKMAKKLESQAK